MTDYHLISHDLCPYVQRAVIVLTEKQIPHRRSYIDLANKPEWFQRISPLGRVPLLQAEGRVLFESQVIVEYLDEVTPGTLHPSDPLDKARHRAWIEFGSDVLKTIGIFYNAPDHKSFAQARSALSTKLSRIEAELDGPLFQGEQFHMVDAVWGTIFRYFDTFDLILDQEILAAFPTLKAWRFALTNRTSIKNAVPDGYPARLMSFLARRPGPMGERARSGVS
ncbi:glutathione S-transferase family protein [Parasedimentitalea huanghaiensis]|uniref:glutathione transferase n=1 Tax=Parasedimentitalea huanghaiensis TaxID=2682100 RepID=A0A6L6WB53_9RHOB|nr:glutathione S-transferase family protein [Zongyanglinia huanghaiensis]MVO15053.1 glutathione S-transferase family protein [Zongyanglinia huanghaiensis]